MDYKRKLIRELDEAELFLRTRAEAELDTINEYDRNILFDIAKTVDNAARAIELAIVPPCKIGDEVYRLVSRYKKRRILPRTVCNMVYVVNYFGEGSWRIITTTEDILGKTVFLTEEEAEAKIKNET